MSESGCAKNGYDFCPFSSLIEAVDRSKSFCRNRFLERRCYRNGCFFVVRKFGWEAADGLL